MEDATEPLAKQRSAGRRYTQIDQRRRTQAMARSARAVRTLTLPTPPRDATTVSQGYRHGQETTARPSAGAAPLFRGKREPAIYRYDSSLSPALDWDSKPAREVAAWLIAAIEDASHLPGQIFPEPRSLDGIDGKPLMTVAGLHDAVAHLKRMQEPFLNWSGKAERLSFDVPTLPLFVHERLSTEAIIRTLEAHLKVAPQAEFFELFADPKMPMSKQVDAYAHKNAWVNRLILGDSLAVMNSLLRYEGLGAQVQMIYMDPPYGVRFGSNFQPFVRKRDVTHGDDDDMTREPEMVQAYRDTWELGLHSYLTYLRDRLLVARDLLTASGSIFVQISDDNLHHVRKLMDEIFGIDNFVVTIPFKKKGNQRGDLLAPVNDYVVWFTKDKARLRGDGISKLYEAIPVDSDAIETFGIVELSDGEILTISELSARSVNDSDFAIYPERISVEFPGARLFASQELTNEGVRKNQSHLFEWRGKKWDPGLGKGKCWKHTAVAISGEKSGMQRLADADRIYAAKDQLRYKRYISDFGYRAISNWWDEVGGAKDRRYVVETSPEIIRRCMLMTTAPGDLVIDPTCGGGTTAYVAEHWGRRWITIDTSRVPLVLTRQRLLTATFPWFRLKDRTSGPSSGFEYERKQNRKGGEVGGIVPHITSSTIANNDPPEEEVMIDRPSADNAITRVSGPFVVEAVLPTPQSLDENIPEAPHDAPSDHIARMIEVLRRSPAMRLPSGGNVTLRNIRRPAKSLSLSAEAMVDHDASSDTVPLPAAIDAAHEVNTHGLPFSSLPVAILFGPPNGAVTAKAVLDAAKEANVKGYRHLYVIGFLFTAEARAEIVAGEAALGLPASPVEMTHDVMMGDLLKTQRSSQIFAITGSPEIAVTRLPEDADDGTPRWQVRLLGLDTFDPAALKPHHLNGDDVPMWMLDACWNGMSFSANQVFFPRTKAWESLRKVLRTSHEDSVWQHLGGDLSAPFAAPMGTEVAVKVLDDRGNELLKLARLGG
jgi:adenine-specific DNA-methyltransferase